MKKIVLPLLLSLFLSSNTFSQSIPNAGFENWTTVGNYSDPQFWDTPNSITATIPIIGSSVVTKAGIAHGGSWCARLESKNLMVATVPGLVTLGRFDADLLDMTFNLGGGAAYNQRPEKLKGYYKYAPGGAGDTCAILVLFFKNDTSGSVDTIGVGAFMDWNAASSWTQFEAPIMWFTGDNPDTVNILAISSASMTGAAGTVLQLDDFVFDFSTGISQLELLSQTISLNYDSQLSLVSLTNNESKTQDWEARLYDMQGRTLGFYSGTLSPGGDEKVAIPELPSGLYIFDLLSGSQHKSLKIIK